MLHQVDEITIMIIKTTDLLMKRFLLLFALTVFFYSCSSEEPLPCEIAMDFISEDVKYPDNAEHLILECKKTSNTNGTFTVLTKVKIEDDKGEEIILTYKLNLKFLGGKNLDKSNWELIDIRSEKSNSN